MNTCLPACEESLARSTNTAEKDIAHFLTIGDGPICVGHSVIAGVLIGCLKYERGKMYMTIRMFIDINNETYPTKRRGRSTLKVAYVTM